MNKPLIQESLADYKQQLAQITNLLPKADAITKLELYDLEKDLKELIAVTEESILLPNSIELQRDDHLLGGSKLGNIPPSTIGEASQGLWISIWHLCLPTELLSIICGMREGTIKSNFRIRLYFAQTCLLDTNSEKEDDNDFVGTKCRVKYTQEWGSFQYHNAMVLNVEAQCGDEDDIKVRVLFLNPTHSSMLPCKYFMDGKCAYGDDCRYSHGYVVPLDDMEEFQEPDFTGLSVGKKCLARYDDGIWYNATICEIHSDQVAVTFDMYNEDDIVLPFHSILPSFQQVSEASDEHEFDLDDSLDIENNAELVKWKSRSINCSMGEWEQHTKGIGSKLMAKMGYVFGKGLGKNSQGALDPVEIRVLPAGKSLDYIAELREKGHIKDPLKKKVKRSSQTQGNKFTTAFDLINNLTHRKANRSVTSDAKKKAKFGIEDSYKLMKTDISSRQKCDDVRQKQKESCNLNMQLFQSGEKIASLKKRLALLQKSLTRNPGNTNVSRTIKHNISSVQLQLDELEKHEQNIHEKLNMKTQSKKLGIF